MDLIVWRHAEAEDGAPDLARKLTANGRAQASRMAAWMQPRLPADLQVLASPAVRAQQTAEALGRPIRIVAALAPGAAPQAILDAAANVACAVIVGHQPDLGRTLAYLVTGEAREWSVDKGALWWLTVAQPRARAAFEMRAVVSPDLL